MASRELFEVILKLDLALTLSYPLFIIRIICMEYTSFQNISVKFVTIHEGIWVLRDSCHLL